MKKIFIILIVFYYGYSMLISGFLHADETEIPAFPGAEGFGENATGGRGGRVLHVTTLEDYGRKEKPITGSLRWALTAVKGPRIVVLDVGGIIRLKRYLGVKPEYGDYTVAGQTAPGGITLSRGFSPSKFIHRAKQGTENFIIRHIRVRGINSEGDGLGLYKAAHCILDHISISEAGDELVDASGATYYTMQWITAEESAWGDQGKKSGSGGLNHNFGPFQAYNSEAKSNFHHVLFAHHYKRAPYIHAIGKKTTTMKFDMRNCVIYNVFLATMLQGPFKSNVINNVYIIGPDKVGGQLYGPDKRDYYSGNTRYPRNGEPVVFKNGGGRTEPWPWIDVTTEAPGEALETVLSRAGAWPRDATTRRTIKEVRSRSGRRSAHGPIELRRERRDGPTSETYDKDRDGMPDTWEKKHGLDPDDPEDRNTIVHAGASPDDRHKGYTYVEYYLNELAENIIGKPSGPTCIIKAGVSPSDGGVINASRAPRKNQSYNMPYVYGIIEWGEEEYDQGSIVVMRAKPKPGYFFSQWEGEPVDGLTALRIQFAAEKDVNITAHFEPAGSTPCTVDAAVSPAGGGNVAGTGIYSKGDIVTLAAYSKKGYQFKKWVGGPLDSAANPVIRFPASGKCEITAEFKKGEGGDFLIDDFNDKDRNSLWKGDSGKPARWSKRANFTSVSEGNYVLHGGYNAFSLSAGKAGSVKIPEGATVFKFRIYNLDEEKTADVRNRGTYSNMRRASYLKWNGWKVSMWYSDPLRFPVIPPGESAVMEIPLPLLKNHRMTRVIKPGRKYSKPFTFFYFGGYYPKSRSPLWKAHIAVDDVGFGRASDKPISVPNLPPVANAGRDQIAGDLDGDGKELVWLNGYNSYDQDAGLIKEWVWTENGKEIAKGFTPGVELPVGEHTLTLTVKDEAGAAAEDTVAVTVVKTLQEVIGR